MIASPVRTTIAFRAVLIAVTTGTSTCGFASRGSDPGRTPIVRPPPRFAPLQAASMTPFSPPHTRTASARAMRNPTSSASPRASGDAEFDPPITEMMTFRSTMASFSNPIPSLKLFDRGYQPRFLPGNLFTFNLPHLDLMRWPWRREPIPSTTLEEKRGNDELPTISRPLKLCEDTLRKNPDDPDALFTKGVFLAKIREYRRALQCLERVATREPAYPGVWRAMATIHVN